MLELSFGGLKTASYWESITALYIVIIGYDIKDSFYWLIFLINGFSAFIAHSPYFHKYYPKLRNLASYIDGASIYYSIILYFLPINKFLIFFTILIIDLISRRKFYSLIIKNKFIFLIPSTILIINKGFVKSNFFLILITLISKLLEEKYILKKFKIKYHSIWHIWGTHMFKNIVNLK